MKAYLITGGSALEGSIEVQGAKNSVLPVLAASLMGRGESVIHNVPRLSDVDASLKILRRLGCRAERSGGTVTVDASALTSCEVPDDLMREMRSSVIFLGAILARLGAAEMSYPGGCELGPRPIDLHLAALRALGADIRENGGTLSCRAEALTGCEISLSLPSVGATENAMLCACGAQGFTTITNAAREPEIVDLQRFLQAMGARVTGAGGSVISVEGGVPLHGGEFTVMGDRIAACTYLCAAASAGGEIEVCGVSYRHLAPITAALSEAGCRVRSTPERIELRCGGPLRAVRTLRTAPYPGFPTDAQALLMGALVKSAGTTVFVENMFENRYRHVDELRRLGAEIHVEGRTAVVCGVPRTSGASVECTDLRGGASLVIAALGAQGTSTITGIRHLERGYDDLPGTLKRLHARIEITQE